MRVSLLTDTGQMRQQNQDAVYATKDPIGTLDNLFIVADGMGGHNAGDYASKEAIKEILDVISSSNGSRVTAIHQGIRVANKKLFMQAKSDKQKEGMGTTIVVATIEDDILHVANVGDSRLYVLENEELIQITRDHSVVEEMVRNGEVSRELAFKHPKRNLITRAVGAEESVVVDFFDERIAQGDTILLCSDGLTTMVPDERIEEILREHITCDAKCRHLVDEANKAGGKDNISVILIEI